MCSHVLYINPNIPMFHLHGTEMVSDWNLMADYSLSSQILKYGTETVSHFEKPLDRKSVV